ncbi:hypothetical protein D3C78_1330000 [compost metagenome]
MLLIILANQVLRTEGISHVEVCPPEGHCFQCMAQGIELHECGVRKIGTDFHWREILGDDRDSLARNPFHMVLTALLAAHQDGLVDEVGGGKCDAWQCIDVVGGAAEKIYFVVEQGIDGAACIWKLPNLDQQAQPGSQDTQVVRGDSFQVMPAGGDIEWRVVRSDDTDGQALSSLQPLPIGL